MKIFIIIVFLLVSLWADAKPLSDQQLKITGRALANYQLCTDVAKKRKDPAMYHYYCDMYNDSLRAGKLFYIRQVQVIFAEQQKTAIKLAQIDKNSITLLCISRFDALSRKMQEQKMAGKIKKCRKNITFKPVRTNVLSYFKKCATKSVIFPC